MPIDPNQEFLVQPVDASWLQCNIECQEACPVGTNCRGYLNLAAEGRFEEGYLLSREPNPVAAMCAYVCSAPCERACRRGDIDRPLAIRAMKRFLVEWHEASGIPEVVPPITPRDERVAVIGAGPAGISVARELAVKGYRVTVFDSLPFAGGTMLIGVPAFRLPREAIEMDVRLVERLGVTFHYNTKIGPRHQLRDASPRLRRGGDLRRRDGRRGAGRPRGRSGRRAVRGRLHEAGQPRRAAGGRAQRRGGRRRLHGHGLLADEPAPRCRERHHRLPPHALGARRRRGGARRDGARGRPDGVPRQPDRAGGRGRETDRRPLHPQQARRTRRVRSPLPGADPRLRVRRAGRHRDPGGLAGGGPELPARRGDLRGRPGPAQGGPGDLCDERARRVRRG